MMKTSRAAPWPSRFSARSSRPRNRTVDGGDLGDVGQHDDRRHRHAPAADPADPRPERLGAPGERGAAVRRVLGQFLVGERDQQHRDERQHEHRRRLVADGEHDVAQRGGQAVGGRDGGQADDDVADEAECAGLQALAAVGWRFGGSSIAMRGNIRFASLLRGFNSEIDSMPVDQNGISHAVAVLDSGA